MSVYQKYGFEELNYKIMATDGSKIFIGNWTYSLVSMFHETKMVCKCIAENPRVLEWEKVIEERKVPDSYLKYKAKTRASNKPKEQKESDVIVLGLNCY